MALDPDLHRVQIDAAQVEQAILHLVTNARDVMPEGGRLTAGDPRTSTIRCAPLPATGWSSR